MKPIIPFVIAATASLLAACSNDTGFRHFSIIDASHVALHARGAPEATLAADGQLAIDGKAVTLTPAQQSLLKDYHAGVMAIVHDATATGAAGMATAATALGAVASGLANGDTKGIDAKVDAKAAQVEAAAMRICADLAALRGKQEAIVAQLPAFAPYATISEDEASGCAAKD